MEIEVRNISKQFISSSLNLFKNKNINSVLKNINFTIQSGELLGIVGESGSGKTTLGKIIAGLLRPSEGEVLFMGKNIFNLKGQELKKHRKNIQFVFQNPFGIFNPKMQIQDHLLETISLNSGFERSESQKKLYTLLDQVQLSEKVLKRYPHQLSGGELRRLGLARVLALNPKVLILDEPVASLDSSIKQNIINLLLELKKELKLTYIWISHDLNFIVKISNRILVLFKGQIMELFTPGSTNSPVHPYTKILIEAAKKISGNYLDWNKENSWNKYLFETEDSPIFSNGCCFFQHCQLKETVSDPSICYNQEPSLTSMPNGSFVSCHYAKKEYFINENINQI